MMLADLGADVIRVQEPGLSGRRAALAAATPTAAPRIDPRIDPRRLAYSSHERNKRSITLNLKHDGAREAFYNLVKISDVVLEGYRPGVSKRLQIDYETLRNINPRLVYCSISGYGQDGPYAALVGHDINYISVAGALGLTGESGGAPAIPLNLIADYGASFPSWLRWFPVIFRAEFHPGGVRWPLTEGYPTTIPTRLRIVST
jgi:crotonobetainyl-CoA:carnitine CoA-transferase CaiB-like acyl-CoA transferase